jgi:hypothetical protein
VSYAANCQFLRHTRARVARHKLTSGLAGGCHLRAYVNGAIVRADMIRILNKELVVSLSPPQDALLTKINLLRRNVGGLWQ